nr:arenicin-4 [Arenicola marina]
MEGVTFVSRGLLAVLVCVTVLVCSVQCDDLSKEPTTMANRAARLSDPIPVTQEFDLAGEKFVIDAENNREIIQLSEGDLEGSVMVIDHAKSLIGWSIPSADECYLIGGVDRALPDSRELLKQFQAGQFIDTTDEDVEDSLTYVKVDDREVSDLSLLPDELLEPCWGKDVFWLERDNSQRTDGRQKRGYCWYVCVNRNGVRACYKRCG